MTFVPTTHVQQVCESVAKVLGSAGGCYSSVLWCSADGVEQFVPEQGSLPSVGRVGETTRVRSTQVVFSILHDDELLGRVLNDGIFASHPWEVPVIQVDEVQGVWKSLD